MELASHGKLNNVDHVVDIFNFDFLREDDT
jgi:hypothetical protein